MTLAERLAAFAAPIEFEDVPAKVVASVRLRALDILGIALAASSSEVAPSVLGALKGWSQGGPCSVVGSTLRTAPPLAALANGALAHGLDFDDTHPISITHASAVILPTVLALGEAGAHSGRALVTAAVAGYEAISRVGMAAPGAFHAGGWHATAVCGAFGATVAAGRLEGLDAARLTAALGIAGSFASGVIEHLEDGSWVKRVHPGWAAHSGIVAAGLARGGFTGPASILEGRFGFYRTFLRSDPDPGPFDTLGKEWETLRIGFKPYPCCHYNHAYLDCALALRRQHGIEPDSIERIECRVPAGEIPIVCEPREAKLRPRTPYDAQFSLAYSVAAALVDGRVGLDTYAKERITDERVLGLASRVEHVVDPASRFPDGFPGWVRIRLRDGRLYEAREPDGRGGAARPIEPEAIVAKFRDNAGRVLPPARVAAIEQAALSLDELSDVSALMVACRV
jgi:2-methylcitrate dehydratase PrpD